MSEAATYLYEEMTKQGFSLTVQGSQLLVSPSGRLTDPLRQQIRENKPALLRLAKPEPPPLTPEERADISEALAERSSIIEFEAGIPRHEADAKASGAMKVYRVHVAMPKGDPRPPRWITMLAPGADLTEATRSARARFGTDRVLEVTVH